MTPIMRQILLSGKKNYIGIRHTAGTFNFGITNGADVLWVFPDGTTSTAAQPNVAVPAGVTKLYASNLSASGVQLTDGASDAIVTSQLRDFNKLTYYLSLYNCANVTGSLADLQGKLTYYLGLGNCTKITGSLADLQGKLTYYLSLYKCSLVTGSLADLQGKLTYYLNLYNCTNITGSLADLQGKLTYYLELYNCAKITGSLADLQGKLTNTLNLGNCSLITGSLADLQGKLTNYLNLANCINITGVYTPVGTGTPTTTDLSNTGLSSADMDNTLIAYAAATKNNGTFTATGMTRSAASDDAVATLGTRGWQISGITKV